MNIAYVDDSEEDCRQSLPVFNKGFLDNQIQVEKIDLYRSSTAFFKKWEEGKYDLIILDIIMDGLTGIELAKKIRETDRTVDIIFCSTSNDFAHESYSVDACYYLHKPISPESTKLMFARLKNKKAEKQKFIMLPDGQRLIPRRILYACYYNHQIEIFLNNKSSIKTRTSFSGFMEQLAEFPYFCICNSGTCLNLYEVERQEKDQFTLSDGTVLQVSRRRRREVLDQYNEFLFRELREGM